MRAERVTALTVAATVTALAVATWGTHAAGYFFLFDDYALVGQATRTPTLQIWTTPLFGFYRPFVFLATKVDGTVFGWQHPAGLLGVNVALHFVNATLVGVLAWRLWPSQWGAVSAGVLFLLSPWSAEAVFWLSGRFDLWATCGVLIAMNAVLRATATPLATAWPMPAAAAAVAVGAFLALFSKEAGLALIALLPLVLLAARDAIDWRRAAALLGIVIAITAAYLLLRSRTLSLLGGTYGDWRLLVRNAPIAGNLRGFVRAVAAPPVAHDMRWSAIGIASVTGPLAVLALAGLLTAACARTRTAVCLVTSLALAVLPAIWVGVAPMSSAGTRVLYLPGVFLVLLLAIGIDVLAESRTNAARWAALGGIALFALHGLISLDAQRRVWAQAATLARAGIEQFRPFVGQTAPLHVTNLPFWFEEGPYVLKSYAYGYYFYPERVPPVSAITLRLAFIDGRIRIITRTPEVGVAGGPSSEGNPVTLKLD